ncbi:MAG: TonB-dependent vitamin B12 receptor [Nitrosomonadaceae bacterium]|nr:TonB-dependent vitamin B12 receptor [Nitrosomonadaceae bacterium]
MKDYRLLVIAVLYLSVLGAALAENGNSRKAVIITANRTAQTADEILSSVTVISRKDIERRQVRSVVDLLRGTQGISIANYGGPGKSTSVFIRGTESDHILVLIDGVRAGSATSGGAAYENIPIEQIERIEIVRGPRSSLYGSEAIGGVIHIFTRKSRKEGLTPSFSISGGSYSTFAGSAGLAGRKKNGWFNINISGKNTNGFNSCTGKSFPNGAGCYTNEPDKDGYHNVAGSFRAGYLFKNGLNIETNFLQSSGKNNYDGTFSNKSELTQRIFGGKALYSPFPFWRITFTGGRSRENSRDFLGKKYTSRFNSRRDTITLQNDFTLNKSHLLTVGADYKKDNVSSSEDFTVTSRNNWGVFAQHQATVFKQNLELSIRYDENEQFGGNVTGGVGWGYTVTEWLRLTASFGTAYKAPTFNELYYPGYSNANLRPEESLSFELGTSGKIKQANWAFNIYETQISDLIAYDATIFAPNNINKVKIRGFEGMISTRIKGWQISTNLTLLDPQNKSYGVNRGNILPRRAKQSFRLDVNRKFDKFTLFGLSFNESRIGTQLLVVGQRYDDLANIRKLGSYVKLDIHGEYKMNQNWLLQGRIENISNERYETASFYNQPGRNFFITLRYQPS